MNIFKKVKLANKLIKIYTEVTLYLNKTHLTDDVRNNIEAIKNALNGLAKDIPAIKELIEIIF